MASQWLLFATMTRRQWEILEGASVATQGAVILLGGPDRRIANGLVARGLGHVDDSGRFIYGAHFVINDIGRERVAEKARVTAGVSVVMVGEEVEMTIDLDSIEARTKAASPGPWLQPLEDELGAIVSADRPAVSLLALDRDNMAIVASDDDAAFIVHAREDVPALCARVREADGALAVRRGAAVAAEACIVELRALAAAWRAYALAVRDQDTGDPAAPQVSDVRVAWDAVCKVDADARAERDAARKACP